MIQASSGGLASQLFSTAVISGSKSLPNLVADCKNSKYWALGVCRLPGHGEIFFKQIAPKNAKYPLERPKKFPKNIWPWPGGVNTVLGQTVVTNGRCCLAELLVRRCKYRVFPGCSQGVPNIATILLMPRS